MVNDAPARLRPRPMVWLSACALVMAVAVACAGGGDEAGPPVTLAGGDGIEAPTSTIPVPALVEEVPEFDPGTDALVTTLTAQVELTDEQRVCLSTRLDGDADLREAIGDRGTGAERWPDVLGAATDCITTVSFSAEFARSQQLAHEGALSEDQLVCLRRGMADLGATDIRRLDDGVSVDQQDTSLGARVRGLIEGCGVSVVDPMAP